MSLALLLLVAVLAYATYYDATGFPRQGTEAEQRAFHRKLYAFQTALFGGYILVAWWITGSLVNSFAVALACIVGTAAHDLVGYWGWRFALGLSRYERGQFFGSKPYTKRTNLLFLAVTMLVLFRFGRGPKWLDTCCRLLGIAGAVYVLRGYA